MAEDAARIERLEAELRRVRAEHAAEVAALREQQTATAEVLRVIASSPGNLQTVIDAVAENAARLCHTDHVGILALEGDAFRLVSRFGPMFENTPAYRRPRRWCGQTLFC